MRDLHGRDRPMVDPRDEGPMWFFVLLLVLFSIAVGFLLFGATAALSQERGIADDDRAGVALAHHRATHRAARKRTRLAGDVIGGRPHGCPHRFCGCALAIKRFGKIVPELNLAWNWRRFPRVPARIGAVAVRRGHVMEIIGGSPGNWTVWDPNSGGGKTRIRQRSLAGYFTVDPAGVL
jgi:hypothetical protein